MSPYDAPVSGAVAQAVELVLSTHTVHRHIATLTDSWRPTRYLTLSPALAAILLKPFIPRSAETIYTSFNFPKPWAEVRYADAAELMAQPDDLRVTAELVDGKVKPPARA